MVISPRVSEFFHHRWTVPLIAALYRADGERFVPLMHRMDVTGPVLRLTLDRAMDAGWVMRNTGHGHPLRPEYILTPLGRELAPACVTLGDLLSAIQAREIGYRKWSLPVLVATDGKESRFGELRDRLPGATDRALSRALVDLRDVRWIERRVESRMRPTVWYSLTPGAAGLYETAGEIVSRISCVS